MRIVLDTNVLVSGLLLPFGPPGEIARMVSACDLTLCVDARVLAECEDVLMRARFRFDRDAVTALLDYIGFRSELVAALPLSTRLPDPDREVHMATNLVIDPDLLDQVLEVSGEPTKKAAVTKALQEFIARREQLHIAELLGKLEWDNSYDYKAERSRRA